MKGPYFTREREIILNKYTDHLYPGKLSINSAREKERAILIINHICEEQKLSINSAREKERAIPTINHIYEGQKLSINSARAKEREGQYFIYGSGA